MKKINLYSFILIIIIAISNYTLSTLYVSAEESTDTEDDKNKNNKENQGISDGVTIKGDPYKIINNDDREAAYMIIVNYMNQLKAMYNLSDESVKKMDSVFRQMNLYVAYNNITLGELNALINDTKSNIKEVIGETSSTPKTESFIFMSSDVPTSSGTYGTVCPVTVGLINLGDDVITDIVVTPVQDADPSKWPFSISTASDAKIIDSLQPCASVEEGALKKKVLTWNFTISDKALNGTYSVPFKVQYYRNGVMKETTITTYATIKAKYGNGDLFKTDTDTETTLSTPRIIVTGFKTIPETVYAGDTFTLIIDVQNTSQATSVSNIQFDLKAASTGTTGNETVDAFLPTSGSSSIYVDRIAPKDSATLSIEMTARNDLTQKPYVITLKSKYEGVKNQSYEAQADISIPVNQESIIDFSDGELGSTYALVGENVNIMFDIYNKGKTTLNNVTISFNDGYVTGGTAFLGKIDPGATGSVDVDVLASMPNTDSGIIVCTISYEDQSGNIIEATKEFNLFIDEAYGYDDSGDYDYEDIGDNDMEQEGNHNNVFIILAIIAGIIIVVVVIVILISKSKAKKRKMLELIDDDNDDGTLL